MSAKFGPVGVTDITSRLQKATKLAQVYKQVLWRRKKQAAQATFGALIQDDF
jgi:hypothetical protein